MREFNQNGGCPRCGGQLLESYGEVSCLQCSYTPEQPDKNSNYLYQLSTGQDSRLAAYIESYHRRGTGK